MLKIRLAAFFVLLCVSRCSSWGEFWSVASGALSITDAAGTALAPGSTITFGTIGMGAGGGSKTLTLKARNPGDFDVTISSVSIVPATSFAVLEGVPLTIPGKQTRNVRVRYTPTTAADDAAITFTSGVGSFTYNLSGAGLNFGTDPVFLLKLAGNLNDSSGNNRDGWPVGAGISYGPDRHGDANGAGVFDGNVANWVTVNATAGWAYNSTYSISAWVRAASPSGASILSRGHAGDGTTQLNFGFASDPFQFVVWRDSFNDDGWRKTGISATIDTHVWMHLAFVSNAGSVTVYRDATPVGSGVIDNTGTPDIGDSSFGLGQQFMLPAFAGSMADVRVYDGTALDAVQVRALFNQD